MSAEDLSKYALLRMKYKTMKSEAKKKISTLETELNNAIDSVNCTRYHMQKYYTKNLSIETETRILREKELKMLRLELDKTKEIMKNNEKLFEEETAKLLSNKSEFTCRQLEDFGIQICKLSEELKKSIEALKSCEKKNQEYVNALNEEKTKSKEKDLDLMKFARQLNSMYLTLNDTLSQLQRANERNSLLESELKSYKELSSKLNEVEKELIDVKHCLCIKTEEIECKNRELNEIQTNQDDIKIIIKQLEDKIISEGEKLKKCDELKNTYDNSCKNLTKENDLLKTENSILGKNVEKLNNSILSACEKEQYWRKHSETCAINLKASIEEIKNLNLEVKCVNEKLDNMEKIFKNTELKLTEETSQKEIFKEKYYNMVNKCNRLDELESLVVQNNVQINNQKLELETLSNENQKMTDINKTLTKRIEDLETARSKERIDEKELLSRLNETMQQLYHAKQNIKYREKEMTSNSQLITELISRGKILKRQNKSFLKIIKQNNEHYDPVNGATNEQSNRLKQRFDEKNECRQAGEQTQPYTEPKGFRNDGDVAESKEKSSGTHAVEKKKSPSARDHVTSNSQPAAKRHARRPLKSGAEMKNPSSSHDARHIVRSVTRFPANGRTGAESNVRPPVIGCDVRGRGPSDGPNGQTETGVRCAGGRSRDEINDARNAIILAKLTRQLNERTGVRLPRSRSET